MEAVVSEMKRQLEDGDLKLDQKISLLKDGINEVLSTAGVNRHSCVLTDVKTRLYLSGILDHCVHILSLDPRSLQGNWSSVTTLAQLTSSCCVGVEPGQRSEMFNRLFLPSVMDGLLSLASHLMRRAECASLFRKVMTDSVGRLFRVHTQLAAQVLSSVHYEQIQMCDDDAVCLLCIQLWIQACTSSSDFASSLTDNSLLLLLNEAVGQLAISSGSAVGAASITLMLLMASQQELRVHRCLLSFRGLDSLLDKDWRGQGFDQDVDQLIKFIQSDKSTRRSSQASAEQVKAACVIQAAWRSYKTRRRVKSLNRAVGTLQRKYRARMKQKQQEEEVQQLEEELRFQVVLRRQQARRQFHERQRDLLQLLPADQLQTFLQECERRAAVVIQRFWRGFKERRRYTRHRNTLRQKQQEQRAAITLQKAVRLFLQKCRASKATPYHGFWIGQKGLTDSRKTELKKQVERYISLQPSSRVSREECERLHEEMQLLLMLELRKGNHQRREEERIEALLARTHTQMELLIDAPLLSAVTESDVESFLSPSASIAARARHAHNEMLQMSRRPWWKTLGKPANADETSLTRPQETEVELGQREANKDRMNSKHWQGF